jgi:hypothetical protein
MNGSQHIWSASPAKKTAFGGVIYRPTKRGQIQKKLTLSAIQFLWTCPAGCLLPSSWAKLHVPVIVTNPSQIGGDEDAKFWLGESLIAVLESFIEVFGYLDGRKDFRFTFGTRKFQGGDVEKSKSLAYGIEERCRNFLVIALINLAAMPVPLRGSQNVNLKTQQVSQHCRTIVQ